MKKETIAITVTTLVLIVYCALATLRAEYWLIMSLFILLHIFTIYMVYAILKNPNESQMKFDDHFYQDRPDIKRNK